jgi:thiamine pyrophosphate-dependent acetolactate synthase large subunit-like protein
MTAVQYQIPVIWIIFDDEEFKLIKLYQLEAYHETGLVKSVPHYSPSPHGIVVGLVEAIEARFRSG